MFMLCFFLSIVAVTVSFHFVIYVLAYLSSKSSVLNVYLPFLMGFYPLPSPLVVEQPHRAAVACEDSQQVSGG